MLIVSIGQGLSTGMISIMSNYIGANEKEKANNVFWQRILISIIISIICFVFAFFGLKELLIIMGAESVIDLTMDYAQTVFAGSIIIILNTVTISSLRAEGDMKKASNITIFGFVLNIILDYFLIYFLNFGIWGAGAATILSTLIGTIVVIYWLFVKKDTYLQTKWSHFKFNMKYIKNILSLSIPATLEGFVMSFLFIFVNMMLIVAGGDIHVVAFTGSWKILSLGMIPAIGVEAAILTISGYYFGSGNYKRIKSIYKYSIIFSTTISIIIAIILFIFANQISYLFTLLNG
ncbi:MAG: MATE family efflux transporter [Methanobrevibacter sp.]|nr:MATE family efflux transporter [Methanobrevibacter sp.]